MKKMKKEEEGSILPVMFFGCLALVSILIIVLLMIKITTKPTIYEYDFGGHQIVSGYKYIPRIETKKMIDFGELIKSKESVIVYDSMTVSPKIWAYQLIKIETETRVIDLLFTGHKDIPMEENGFSIKREGEKIIFTSKINDVEMLVSILLITIMLIILIGSLIMIFRII